MYILEGELKRARQSVCETCCESSFNKVEQVVRPWSKQISVLILFFALIAISNLLMSMNGRSILSAQSILRSGDQTEPPEAQKGRPKGQLLEEILKAAATPEKIAIIAPLNAAWAENNSMIDMFLESFHLGNDTEWLLNHLIIVALDQKAFKRCKNIHKHCFKMKTPGVDFSQEKSYMSEDYLKMVWRKIQFLGTVLDKGYSFIFTDADILWLRNPFQQFRASGIQLDQVDLAFASDIYNGDPYDIVHNWPNSGFMYARATNRTRSAYTYWYKARKQHQGNKSQDVFDAIKFESGFQAIGLKLMFLDTQFFGGFCEIQKTDLAKVVTMHATCCKGLEAKLKDLRLVLNTWIFYRRNSPAISTIPPPQFKALRACPRSWGR